MYKRGGKEGRKEGPGLETNDLVGEVDETRPYARNFCYLEFTKTPSCSKGKDH